GLVSGLDTASIIQQLLDARKAPIQALQTQVVNRRTESNAIRDINSRLTNLFTQAKKFADLNYVQGKSAGVSAGGATAAVGVSAIGARIDPNALLKDANLGQAVTAGNFTVNGTQISVDPATDTLNTVMQRVRDNVPGTTVSLVADGSGRNNLLQIAGASSVTL